MILIFFQRDPTNYKPPRKTNKLVTMSMDKKKPLNNCKDQPNKPNNREPITH